MGGSGAATIFGSGARTCWSPGIECGPLGRRRGNETLSGIGSSGNNVMWAGAGSDLMGGGSGNETFFAGQGNAAIIGGSGADLFAFVNGHGRGRLMSSGIQPRPGRSGGPPGLWGRRGADDLAGATVANGSTTITLSDHTSVTFAGVSNLTQSAFT